MTNFQPACEPASKLPDGMPDGTQVIDALCPKHGACKAWIWPDPIFPDKTMGPIMKCQPCSDERAAAKAAEEVNDAQQKREQALARIFDRSGIPLRFRGSRLDNYAATNAGQKRALQTCRWFVENWETMLRDGFSPIFTGSPGTGKTHLACGIASALIERHGASALFMTALGALRSIKATYNRNSDYTEQDAIDALIEPELLVLDEIGCELGSEHEKVLLFDVINTRYQRCLPTMMLSNLNKDDLETYLGQRVMDRYRECGAVIAFNWDSHRGTR